MFQHTLSFLAIRTKEAVAKIVEVIPRDFLPGHTSSDSNSYFAEYKT